MSLLTPTPAVPEDEGQEINTNVFNANNHMDNTARVHAEGFEVFNNNGYGSSLGGSNTRKRNMLRVFLCPIFAIRRPILVK